MKKRGPIPTLPKSFDLKHFILKTNSLLMYRESIKFTYKIIDTKTRIELQNFIRNEFEANKNIDERKKLEYLLGTARKRINQFKETFYMSN